MRSALFNVFAASTLALALTACDDSQNEAVTDNADLETEAGGDNTTYGEKALVNTWPSEAPDTELATHIAARNYYLVFDGSGSMSESECSNGQSKIAVAKTAIKRFLDELPADANIGLYAFDYAGETERVPLGENHQSLAKQAVDAIEEGGGTPLSTAIEAGYGALTAQAQKQLGYGEYHLVVITDGYATEGYAPDAVLNTLLVESPVIVHGIGFCVDEGHSLNLQGKTFFTSAQNPEMLAAGLSSVLAEAPDFTDTSWSGK